MDFLKYAWFVLPIFVWAEFHQPPISTFSIVARDPETGEIGVAVQSKFVAVGSVVPYAKAGIGAVASQAWGTLDTARSALNCWHQGSPPRKLLL